MAQIVVTGGAPILGRHRYFEVPGSTYRRPERLSTVSGDFSSACTMVEELDDLLMGWSPETSRRSIRGFDLVGTRASLAVFGR